MNIAAFFDLDGTLLAHPSLELRFFQHACLQGMVKPGSCARWIARQWLNCIANLPTDPAGRVEAIHSNKLWLAGMHASAAHSWARDYATRVTYLPAGLARLAWHLERSHRVFIVTGALAPIVRELIAAHPIFRNAEICATELEVGATDVFTGQTRGAAIAGREKARAVAQLAVVRDIDLARSFAYANSSVDRWFLAAVRHAFAVNPDRRLAHLARIFGWPIIRWTREITPEMSLGFESPHPIIWREVGRG